MRVGDLVINKVSENFSYRKKKIYLCLNDDPMYLGWMNFLCEDGSILNSKKECFEVISEGR